jgi:hypothetical protein
MPALTTRRRRTAAAVVTATTLAGSGLLVAAQPAATGAAAMTFRFEDSTFKYIDVPPLATSPDEAPSPGDYFVLTNKLFRGEKRVGGLHATCLFVKRTADPARLPLLCSGAYTLPGGTLVGSALLRSEDPVNHIAVTGGTGRYAGMSGTATEHPRPDGSGRVEIDVR